MSNETNEIKNEVEVPTDVRLDANEDVRKNKEPRRVTLFAFILTLVSVTLAAVMITHALSTAYYKKQLAQSATTSVGDTWYAFDLFSKFIDEEALVLANEDEMMIAALKAYIDATGDKFAEYYTAEEYESMTDTAESRRQGMGVYFAAATVEIDGKEERALLITKVVKDSPAMKSGILKDDLILGFAIEGVGNTVTDVGHEGSVDMMRVEAGTEILVKLLREIDGKNQILEISVVCDKYEVPTVEGYIHENDKTVGVVKITQFSYKTPKEFSDVMDELIGLGATNFVFDMRNNLGGHLESIHAILSFFLEEGDATIKREYRDGRVTISTVAPVSYTGTKEMCTVKDTDIGKYRGYKFAVLCNGSTASAAELFTASFDGYDLGTIVGTKTVGKGTVQSTFSLSKWGYKGYLKLTTSKYYSPRKDGNFLNYDGVGITPHKEVELTKEGDAQLDKALECFK